MTAYVKSVIENTEVVNVLKDVEYMEAREEIFYDLEADVLSLEEIENMSHIEHKIYAYMERQGLELIASDQKYSTALVNHPCYNAINIERHLLTKENANERVFSLAHELGHFLDVKFNQNGSAFAFGEWYRQYTKAAELIAWLYGWEVLEALGCTLKDEYFKTAKECLNTYVRNMKKVEVLFEKSDEIIVKYEERAKQPMEIIC